MQTVAFHTLGCKVNQYDTQAMREAFERAGYTLAPFDGPADVYVVNTCTVTGTGDKKSMQAVRRAFRQNPRAEVVIAGCLAQREGEALLRTGARLVLGTQRRGEVVTLLAQAIAQGKQLCAVGDVADAPFEQLMISRQEGHTRAVLKIQEGCDNFCAYCIIPYVRGGVRSRPVAQIAAEAARLARAGFAELVLTGIHLTSYGRDLDGQTLLDAVRAVHAIPGVTRIRLGSLEPVVSDGAFVSGLAALPKVCPQFHLALQSGSDAVLARMRRRYDTAAFRAAAGRLRAAFPGCALTTDVLTGFPGETQAEFEETLAFCREMGFARMHVFPFSPRKGTPAADMPGQLPRAVKEARARALIALGRELSGQYRAAMLGGVREVLFEEEEAGVFTGYTPEYMPVRAPGGVCGRATPVRLTALCGDGFAGECVCS